MFSFRLGEEVTNSVRIVLKDRGWRDVSRRQSKSKKRAAGSRRDCHVELRTYRFKESEYAAAHASGGATKLNHFPRTSDITQKDKLTRHLRRMQVVHGSTYSFFPESFILPRERTQFEQAFAAAAAQAPAHAASASGSNKTLWICKPSASSQGRGIFLIDDLKDVVYDSPYVVQRYLADPYLIGGYKFDIRLYVLLNSFRPLEIFLYRRGLARFGTQKYEGASIDKLFAHLTNASINKHNRAEFGADKDVIGAGSKWTLPRLFAHLRDEGGVDVVALWARHATRVFEFVQLVSGLLIKAIVSLTMMTIIHMVPANVGCFELFGFDIMLDSTGKPWLLEVNCSPALAISGDVDRATKVFLLNDIMQVIGMGDEPPYLSDDQYSDDDDENEVAHVAATVADSANWHLRQADVSRSSSSLATSSGASLRPSPLNGHPLAAGAAVCSSASAASSGSGKLRQPSTFARAGAMALGGGGGDGSAAAGGKPLSARRGSGSASAASSAAQSQAPPPQRASPSGSVARPLPGSARGGSIAAAAASVSSSSGRGAAPAASGLPPRRPGAGAPLPLVPRSNSNRTSALPVGGSSLGSALPSAPSPALESRDLPSIRNRYASGLFGNMWSAAGIGGSGSGSGGGGRLGGNNVSPLVHAASVAALASVSAWGRDEFQSSSSSESDDDGPWFGGRGSDNDDSRDGDDCDADVEFDPDDFGGTGDEGDDFDAGSVRRRGRAINDGEPEEEEKDEDESEPENENENENEAGDGASADVPKRQRDGRRPKDAAPRATSYRERALLAESRVGGALSLPGDDAGASDPDDEYAVRLPASSDSLLECGLEAGARAPFGDFERVFPFNATTARAANALLTPGDSRNTPANVFQQFLRVAVSETRVALAAAIAPPKKAKKLKKKQPKPAAASGGTDDFI